MPQHFPASPLISPTESSTRDDFLWKAALLIGESKPSLARYMLKELDRGAAAGSLAGAAAGLALIDRGSICIVFFGMCTHVVMYRYTR